MPEQRSAKQEVMCSCKLGRNSRKYDRPGLSTEITQRHENGNSLRELEEIVNKAFLGSALHEAEVDVIGDVNSIYRSLTDDSTTAGSRTETRERLSNAGLDIESLEEDFVSYQTVRTHLQQCLGIETNRSNPTTIEDARGTIEWARSRSEGIVERTLERLQTDEQLNTGDLEMSHIFRVTCSDCGSTYSVNELLDDGSCRCNRAT